MQKNFTTVEIRNIGTQIISVWDTEKVNIKLNGKNLYNLIGLKKLIEQKIASIEETVMIIAQQYGAETQENGTLVIPQENRAIASEKLQEFGAEIVSLEYEEIFMTQDTSLPIAILEPLFDFITILD